MRLSNFMLFNGPDCCKNCWSELDPEDMRSLQMVQITPNGKMHLWDGYTTRTDCGMWLIPFDNFPNMTRVEW